MDIASNAPIKNTVPRSELKLWLEMSGVAEFLILLL